MKLYKYVTGARIDILQNQKIRFSQPYALNAPFETQPYYSDHKEINPLKKLAEFAGIVKEVQDTGVIPEEKVARWEEDRKKPQKNILSWYVNTNLVSLSLTEDYENLLMWHIMRATIADLSLNLTVPILFLQTPPVTCTRFNIAINDQK